MKLETKSRKAIDAILDLAIHGADRPVRMIDISERQRVSVSHLEVLFRKLLRSGFVASHRGPGGGYQLSRALDAISVADIVDAVDGKSADRDLPSGSERGDDSSCMTNGLWRRVNAQLRDYLRSVTLESVLADAMGTGSRCATGDGAQSDCSGSSRIGHPRPSGASKSLPSNDRSNSHRFRIEAVAVTCPKCGNLGAQSAPAPTFSTSV